MPDQTVTEPMSNIGTAPAESWGVRLAESVLARRAPNQLRWHYEDGLLIQAISGIGALAGIDRCQTAAREYAEHFVAPDGTIRSYRLDEFNLDQVNPGKVLFPVYRQTGEDRYRKALELLRDQLRCQPRAPSGGFWHKQIYPDQMWLDGGYMAGPFYAEYARTFNEPAGFDDVVRQLILLAEHTRAPESGLLRHGWDESRRQRWADPQTGRSPQVWGRGMGWFTMAVVDVLDFLPAAHAGRMQLARLLNQAIDAVARVQDAATGLWHQVLDRAGSPGNYLESSASAMFAYAIAKGVRQGHLPADRLPIARRAFEGLTERRLKVDSNGQVSLEGTCSVAGLGGHPYRDGSYEYYVGEDVAVNDPKGVGAFLLAAAELEFTPGGRGEG